MTPSSHTEALAEALKHWLAQIDHFREIGGNQADAYYHFVKGQDQAWAETREALAAYAARPTVSDGPWRCFHCDEVFTDRECAAHHFGKFEDCDPICKVGAERYRELEDQLSAFRSESDEASKTFYALGADHSQALMRAEEKGYERGLRDGRATPPDTASTPAHAVEMLAAYKQGWNDREADLLAGIDRVYGAGNAPDCPTHEADELAQIIAEKVSADGDATITGVMTAAEAILAAGYRRTAKDTPDA